MPCAILMFFDNAFTVTFEKQNFLAVFVQLAQVSSMEFVFFCGNNLFSKINWYVTLATV